MKCGICSEDKVRLGPVVVCVRCDWPLEGPFYEFHWGLVMKAHDLGIGRLEKR